MKKLLLGCLLILPSCLAMEHPAKDNSSDKQEEVLDIAITEPYVNTNGNLRAIEAFDGDMPIGCITYSPKAGTQNLWSISLFQVARKYRKIGLGRELFGDCITDIKAQGGTQVIWEALPTNSKQINLETLIIIYKGIIEKLGFTSDALAISPPQGSGIIKQVVMTLRLS